MNQGNNPNSDDNYEFRFTSDHLEEPEVSANDQEEENKVSPADLFNTQFKPQEGDTLNPRPNTDQGNNLSELTRGAVIDNKYEIIELIGKGGMSTVFQVKHVELDTILALKVLDKAAWQDPDAMARFKLEAQTIGRLNSPSLITYRDFGVSGTGQPYLVMDYVEGNDLYDTLKELGPFTLTGAYELWTQICEGLSIAHNKGIVHRDLKPGNIMFDEADNNQVKIVDFGVAKIVTEDANQMQNLTQTGEVFGSPLYMSPEQCQGKKVDLRSDIYSLGCVIYETITGVHPIRGDTMLITLTNHVEKMHPLPLKIDPTLAGIDRSGWVSPEDFQYILMRCLQKNPKDRYQNVDEILEDLIKLKEKTLVKQALPSQTVSSLRKQIPIEQKTSPKDMIVMGGTLLFIALGIGIAAAATWYFLFSGKTEIVGVEQTKENQEKEPEKTLASQSPIADGSLENQDSNTSYNRAVKYMKNKKYKLAISHLNLTIEALKAQGNQSSRIAECYQFLGKCYTYKDDPDYNQAVNSFNSAIAIYKTFPRGQAGFLWMQCYKQYAECMRKFGHASMAKELENKASQFQAM